MSEKMVLAVPSIGDGGLDGERSAHFGHSDCFTLVEIAGEEITDVRVVSNPPHEHGGCMRPVALLATHGVDAIVVGGMGARPLAGFSEAGIVVYFENETPGIGAVVGRVLSGAVGMMDGRHVCGGH